MKFKAYHKIKQFKDTVRDIQFKANFKGLDEEGNPIYEESAKPVIRFTGTVKLHGTNAGICYVPNFVAYESIQGSLLNKENVGDHMGFNDFVLHTEKEAIKLLMEDLWILHCKKGEQITLYGEWAGKGIQKGVGISSLDKAFYIFDCKVYNPVTEESRWVDVSVLSLLTMFQNNIYSIHSFSTFSLDIDFNNPVLSQNKLIEITEQVEKECPVTKQLGGTGIGEGVVWTGFWNNQKYIFKVKGEKHSTSKVKTLASVDPEVVKSISDFMEYACTQNRIEQGIQEVNATEKRHMPDLLKWVANDIIAEEADVLKANNLEWKQVARDFSNRVRQYYFAKLDKI